MAGKTPKGISPILLRFFLISSSIFLLICGICLTVLGLYYLYHATGIGVDRNFLFLPGGITILGMYVFGTGIVGFVCVCYRSKYLTITFVTITVIGIICQVSAGSVVLALSDDLADIAATAIRIKVNIVNNHTADYHKEKEAFRSFQITMKCCGAKGPSDYTHSKEQCCRDNTCGTVPEKGCVDFVKEVAQKYKVPYGLMMIIFGVMQISAIVSSIAWVKWKRKPLLV